MHLCQHHLDRGSLIELRGTHDGVDILEPAARPGGGRGGKRQVEYGGAPRRESIEMRVERAMNQDVAGAHSKPPAAAAFFIFAGQHDGRIRGGVHMAGQE